MLIVRYDSCAPCPSASPRTPPAPIRSSTTASCPRRAISSKNIQRSDCRNSSGATSSRRSTTRAARSSSASPATTKAGAGRRPTAEHITAPGPGLMSGWRGTMQSSNASPTVDEDRSTLLADIPSQTTQVNRTAKPAKAEGTRSHRASFPSVRYAPSSRPSSRARATTASSTTTRSTPTPTACRPTRRRRPIPSSTRSSGAIQTT